MCRFSKADLNMHCGYWSIWLTNGSLPSSAYAFWCKPLVDRMEKPSVASLDRFWGWIQTHIAGAELRDLPAISAWLRLQPPSSVQELEKNMSFLIASAQAECHRQLPWLSPFERELVITASIWKGRASF